MNDVKVKFCGLYRREDIEYANILNPDYVGFVFAKSKRQISSEKAAEFRKQLKKEILSVGVFVDENPDFIIHLLLDGVIDLAQLHGSETKEEIAYLKYATNQPVIKALRESEFHLINEYENSTCDYLLLDSGGGTGTQFNWEGSFVLKKPFFLAGGITVENVVPGVHHFQPYGIDVSSGIETDGKKDFEKMQALLHQLKTI